MDLDNSLQDQNQQLTGDSQRPYWNHFYVDEHPEAYHNQNLPYPRPREADRRDDREYEHSRQLPRQNPEHPFQQIVVPAEGVGYTQKELDKFKQIDYLRRMNGHCEFKSSNTLRNSVGLAIGLDSNYPRFRKELKGGYFANTTSNVSSFAKNDPHRPNEPKKEDLPNGRPLFTMELRRNQNKRHVYDIKRNPEFEQVQDKKTCTFGNSYRHYRRTCDMQGDIRVYDYAADKSNADQLNPNMGLVKKRWPGYSQSKAKQFTLWDKEVKLSGVQPGPYEYEQGDDAVKPKRFNGVGLGLDIKCTLRDIELTPGAGDYNTVQTGNEGNSFLKKTHNYFLANGGMLKPNQFATHERLMEKAFISGHGLRKSRAGSAFSRKSGGQGGYGQASNRDKNHLQQNIMAVKNHNTYNMGNNQIAHDMTMLSGIDQNASDMMMQGKYINESVSESNAGTNYTNNRQRAFYNEHLAASQDPDNKKNKKSRRLPNIPDDTMSPKNMQYSSDFARGRNKRGVYGGAHQGGYETENVVSPDHTRNDIFKFGSTTNDSGFEMSHGNDLIMHDNMIHKSVVPKKKKPKNYTYMTLKNDHKSRSVTSNIGRLDHTCFI